MELAWSTQLEVSRNEEVEKVEACAVRDAHAYGLRERSWRAEDRGDRDCCNQCEVALQRREDEDACFD